MKYLQAFANKLKWPTRHRWATHKLKSRANVALGVVPFDHVSVLHVDAAAGCADANQMQALAMRYPTVKHVYVNATPGTHIDLTAFKCEGFTVGVDAASATTARVTPPVTATYISLEGRVRFEKHTESMRTGAVIELSYGATPSTANIPSGMLGALELVSRSPISPALQADVQGVIMGGSHAQVVVRSDSRTSDVIPWQHVVLEAKQQKPRHIALELAGCLSTSVGFLTSRAFDAVDYQHMKRLSLALDAFAGSGARMFELIQILSRKAFALEKLTIKLMPSYQMPVGTLPLIIGALLARKTESDYRNRVDAKAPPTGLYNDTKLSLIYTDKESRAEARAAITNLTSIFTRSAPADRKEHLRALALSSKNAPQLLAYLDMSTVIKLETVHHAALRIALKANAYVPGDAMKAIDAIFSNTETEIGTHITTKASAFGVFAIKESAHTLHVSII